MTSHILEHLQRLGLQADVPSLYLNREYMAILQTSSRLYKKLDNFTPPSVIVLSLGEIFGCF